MNFLVSAIYHKVEHELKEHAEPLEMLKPKNLNTTYIKSYFPYTRKVIMESLRLWPVAPIQSGEHSHANNIIIYHLHFES